MTHNASVKLSDGTEVDCEFEVIEHGSPGNGWDDPGEGSIVGVIKAEREDGTEVELSDDVREFLELKIAEDIDADPYYFGEPDD